MRFAICTACWYQEHNRCAKPCDCKDKMHMICKFCSTGADMQHRANEIRTLKSANMHKSFATRLEKGGLTLHGFCTGEGHCDCQHKPVGKGNVENGA